MTSDAWPALIADGGYEAIIFDCDGTLVESSEAHFQAFQTAIRTQGHEMERLWYNQRTGLDRQSTLAAFAKTTNGQFDVSMAVTDSIAAFILNKSAVSPIFETTALAKMVRRSCKLAVVTNSEREVAGASLTAIGLQAHFDHIVTISDGLPPKPAPDLFVAAASLLNTSIAKTLILEDSKEGVQGAIRAGIDVLEVMSMGFEPA